jgi:hypothetical protein
MIDRSNLFLFQIYDINLWFWYIHHDDFFLIYHTEKIDDVWVFMLVENLSFRIYMNDAFIFPGIYHSWKDYCIIVGSRKAQDFWHLLLEFYLNDLFK